MGDNPPSPLPPSPSLPSSSSSSISPQSSLPTPSHGKPVLFIASFLSALLLALVLHMHARSGFTSVNNDDLGSWAALVAPANARVFSAAELREFNGENGKPAYLACLGQVFDVSAGDNFYGKDAHYHGFVGRDGSRAFTTGQFDEAGLVADLSGLTNTQIEAIHTWLKFYTDAAHYPFVGVLEGAFYDAQGRPRRDTYGAVDRVVRLAQQERQRAEEMNKVLPRCSTSWSSNDGGWVWCERDAFPRKVLYRKVEDGAWTDHCVCLTRAQLRDVETGESEFRIAPFLDCPDHASRCALSQPQS